MKALEDGDNFFTKKVVKWLKENVQNHPGYSGERLSYEAGYHIPFSLPKLKVGNLSAYRDIGHARDYTFAMIKMLDKAKPEDYVCATGEAYSMEEFLARAFAYYGLDWKEYTEVDPKLFRPCEVPYLRGKPTKMRQELGWIPKADLDGLIKDMIENAI